jgi:excisionase family DNA binding protein
MASAVARSISPPARTLPRLLSLRAVSERTTVPLSTWYTLVAKGEIRAVRIGRSVRIDEADLVHWIDARRETAR